MVIAPIASAFEHCAGMDVSGHSPESQSQAVVAAEDVVTMDHDLLLNGQQANMDCHTSSSCTFHVCGGDGLISSAAAIDLSSSVSYSAISFSSSYHTVSLPDLRPPISIL